MYAVRTCAVTTSSRDSTPRLLSPRSGPAATFVTNVVPAVPGAVAVVRVSVLVPLMNWAVPGI